MGKKNNKKKIKKEEEDNFLDEDLFDNIDEEEDNFLDEDLFDNINEDEDDEFIESNNDSNEETFANFDDVDNEDEQEDMFGDDCVQEVDCDDNLFDGVDESIEISFDFEHLEETIDHIKMLLDYNKINKDFLFCNHLSGNLSRAVSREMEDVKLKIIKELKTIVIVKKGEK